MIYAPTRQRTRTPLSYYGGKQKLAPHLLALLPQHDAYVEVFGGGAALLFAKPPAPVEVYNDRDAEVVNFFGVLRGPEGDALIRSLRLTPHSRDEHSFCRSTISQTSDRVERARRFYVSIRQSYGSIAGDAYQTGTKGLGRAWANRIDELPVAVERLRHVQIENSDFRTLIPKYDRPDVVLYCDPPYLPEVRTSHAQGARQRKYRQEMSRDDHVELLHLLRRTKAKVMLSGYDSELYSSCLPDWRRFERRMQTPSGTQKNGQANYRIECVWMNY